MKVAVCNVWRSVAQSSTVPGVAGSLLTFHGACRQPDHTPTPLVKNEVQDKYLKTAFRSIGEDLLCSNTCKINNGFSFPSLALT